MSLRQQFCPAVVRDTTIGAGATEAVPCLGSAWPPLLARSAPQWALASEGLPKRGDTVARHLLLGNALFLLAWPLARGLRLLWSSACLLQPLALPQSPWQRAGKGGASWAVGPHES